MIPKTLHYIWLSDNPKSWLIEQCISSWKKYLPDYKIVGWNFSEIEQAASDLRVDNPLELDFVEEAVVAQKWAFATDYLRQWVIYHFGGIYFDTDIALTDRFAKIVGDDASYYNFFSCVEYHQDLFLENKDMVDERGFAKSDDFVPGLCIQAALVGGSVLNSLSRKILEFYQDKHFVLEDGSYFDKMVAPDIAANVAREFGFRYILDDQVLSNNDNSERYKIYGPQFCATTVDDIVSENVAFHLCEHSWVDVDKKYHSNIKKKLNKAYRITHGLPKVF